ncbi:MAG TPA: VOC family protein, partial [Blastocatellia bacterium]|nr:VOC family protein [Blastocatellia bacterium]
MSVRWTHITVAVSNFGRSIEFYERFCGLTVVRDRRKSGGGGTVWLGSPSAPAELPTFVLVLIEGPVTSKLDHLGFQCQERNQVDRLAEEAGRLGILVDPPTDSGGA